MVDPTRMSVGLLVNINIYDLVIVKEAKCDLNLSNVIVFVM